MNPDDEDFRRLTDEYSSTNLQATSGYCAVWVIAGLLLVGCNKSHPESTEFGGFSVDRFQLDGRYCAVVKPIRHFDTDGNRIESPVDGAADGRPWALQARFFHGAPQLQSALLERGFHYAWIDVSDSFGNAAAMAALDRFHDYVCREYQLSETAVLEGFSRGGLIAMNWASRNPSRVAGIYLDAPVLDFRSWPAGNGSGKGSPENWKKCLAAWELTESEALKFEDGPLSETNLRLLASADIPILTVCGDADDIVPYQENSAVLIERYKLLGGSIDSILKTGGGHHPHCLEDPRPIVAFIENAFQAGVILVNDEG